jgi:indole-3-glycerol phosphate synthase
MIHTNHINNKNNILEKITATKRQEIEAAKKTFSLEYMKAEAYAQKALQNQRGFNQKLIAKISDKENAIIAEIKKASPSKGVLREDFSIKAIAQAYQNHGATCLSVLTDMPYFQGAPLYLRQARIYSELPILRKDFIIDPYQIYESKMMGADAILLIADILSKSQIEEFECLATELDLCVLPEIHHRQHIEKIMDLKSPMLGINNRNLANFTVDLNTTHELSALLKAENKTPFIISESGFQSFEDLKKMNADGVYGFLIGEHFMRQNDIGQALADILGNKKNN